ncbi:MAG: phosphoenolpyruvate--protein phosphotransferase [Ardenticatenaceae bacterium]|nr:phosphoenolpyruvate--protein phosphotransferase [Ardenticatenaceae bacterium]
MVGIVIVSHSNNLAIGVQELAQQMTPQSVPIAAAGGIEDPENPIGTNPIRVYEAINEVYSDDGVLILMDLGSALLSAETALEMLLPEQQERVQLCAAPLVEGTMSAVVQASIGGTLEQVAQEAMGALGMKQDQLGEYVAGGESVKTTLSPLVGAQELTLVVRNRLGLHARPAARFVTTANQFKADLQLRKGGQLANAKSINQVATLGVRQGDKVVVLAKGPDATAALTAIQALAADNFGDRDDDVSDAPVPMVIAPLAEGELGGIPASPGIAIGPVALYRPRLPDVEVHTITDTNAEWRRLQTAVTAAQAEINSVYQQALQQVGKDEAAIFEAHLLFLQDPDMIDAARDVIMSQRLNAEAAWQQVVTNMAASYQALTDPYMQARAADVVDVGQRVLAQMMDVERPSLDFEQPSILVATDLTPSDTARMNPDKILGICTELGGSTSHSAILARALGIPAVVGIGNALAALNEGQMLALDGALGRVWVDPDYDTQADLQAQRQVWLGDQLRAKEVGQQPAVTKDGHAVEIVANIGGPNDTRIALEYGAEGVGLFRTEFMFLGRETAPTEEEQYEAYRQVVRDMGKRPLIIRTLDVGGDKPLPYFERDPESNPFLGWRGIRFCLDHPEIFKPQLRAILRASVDEAGDPYSVKIMFPMIGCVAELRAAKAVLADVQAELQAEGQPFDTEMEVGIMIEVPSAVAVADQLAKEADFFSIGTNDLTQYAMAADRGNAKVADLANALQPAVLRLVQQTVSAGHAAGIWVGMCGELAGKATAVPVLIGLGLDELSMSAPAVPDVKEAIRRLKLADAQRIAGDVLQLDTAQAVQTYLTNL